MKLGIKAAPTKTNRPKNILSPQRASSRFRRLAAEALETRFALSTASLGSEAVIDNSLAEYLATTPEMGPVAPPAVETAEMDLVLATALPALDPLSDPCPEMAPTAVDPYYTSLGSTNEQGEGEAAPFKLTSFTAERSNGMATLQGWLSGYDGQSVNIYFEGAIGGTVMPNFEGYFIFRTFYMGYGGVILAHAEDSNGLESNTMEAWI
jgi:hypothetical protein